MACPSAASAPPPTRNRPSLKPSPSLSNAAASNSSTTRRCSPSSPPTPAALCLYSATAPRPAPMTTPSSPPPSPGAPSNTAPSPLHLLRLMTAQPATSQSRARSQPLGTTHWPAHALFMFAQPPPPAIAAANLPNRRRNDRTQSSHLGSRAPMGRPPSGLSTSPKATRHSAPQPSPQYLRKFCRGDPWVENARVLVVQPFTPGPAHAVSMAGIHC